MKIQAQSKMDSYPVFALYYEGRYEFDFFRLLEMIPRDELQNFCDNADEQKYITVTITIEQE